MNVECGFCGGLNEIFPDESIIRCAYCGSTIALKDNSKLKHLVLKHTPDIKRANEELSSYILRKTNRVVECENTKLYYVPFISRGDSQKITSIARDERFKGLRTFQPYGIYTFLDDFLLAHEGEGNMAEVIEMNKKENNDYFRIIYVPIYEITYKCNALRARAFVVGETFEVYAVELPERAIARVNSINTIVPISLFAIFFVSGIFGGGLLLKTLISSITAGLAYVYLSFMAKEKKWKAQLN